MHRCLSGGARGADCEFGRLALNAGHELVHYSFDTHKIAKKEQALYAETLDQKMLEGVDPSVDATARFIGRKWRSHTPFVKNLLRRNMFQVLNTERVYSIGYFDEKGYVGGGTGWAVGCAIINGVSELYHYNQVDDWWYAYGLSRKFFPKWERIYPEEIPVPNGNYTGIGTRELSESGKNALENLYER